PGVGSKGFHLSRHRDEPRFQSSATGRTQIRCAVGRRPGVAARSSDRRRDGNATAAGRARLRAGAIGPWPARTAGTREPSAGPESRREFIAAPVPPARRPARTRTGTRWLVRHLGLRTGRDVWPVDERLVALLR